MTNLNVCSDMQVYEMWHLFKGYTLWRIIRAVDPLLNFIMNYMERILEMKYWICHIYCLLCRMYISVCSEISMSLHLFPIQNVSDTCTVKRFVCLCALMVHMSYWISYMFVYMGVVQKVCDLFFLNELFYVFILNICVNFSAFLCSSWKLVWTLVLFCVHPEKTWTSVLFCVFTLK